VERPVKLVAKAAYVHLDDVGIAVEITVPHVCQDLPLTHHLTPAPQQNLQQGKLTAGQGQSAWQIR
jgi:hypothetical protein